MGEEARNTEEAIKYILDIDRDLIYIDDKNINLAKLRNLNIKLTKRRFYSLLPFELAWKYPKIKVLEVNILSEI